MVERTAVMETFNTSLGHEDSKRKMYMCMVTLTVVTIPSRYVVNGDLGTYMYEHVGRSMQMQWRVQDLTLGGGWTLSAGGGH